MEAPASAHARSGWLQALALLLITLVAYSSATELGFVVDDREYIEENVTLESAAGLGRIWTDIEAMPHRQYYPLVLTTFWLEHQVWGKDPLGYHVVNVLLHALNAILVWRLLTRLSIPGAWLAGALFALHPVHVETVAWVTERKNLVYVAFYLLAAITYLRSAGVDPAVRRADPAPPRRGWYAASLVLFLLALTSKASAFSLPAALALALWMKEAGPIRRHVVRLAPFVVMAVVFGALSAYAESQWVGAEGEQWDETGAERVLIAGRALWFYAAKLVWPHPLSFNYSRWAIDTGSVLQIAFPVSAALVPFVLLAVRRRIGTGPLIAVLFFGGSMLPFLGFVNFFFMRYSYVADHLQYLSSIGLIALAAAGLVRLGARLEATVGPWIPRLAGGALLVAFGALVHARLPVYESDETLWRATAEENPEAWVAHMLLGYELAARGAHEEAIASFDRAIPLAERHPSARTTSMKGTSLYWLERYDEAIACFRETLEVKPTHFESHYYLALSLDAVGRDQQAIRHYATVLRIDSRDANAMERLAAILAESGQTADAVRLLREALAIEPERASARRLLRRVQRAAGEGAQPPG